MRVSTGVMVEIFQIEADQRMHWCGRGNFKAIIVTT